MAKRKEKKIIAARPQLGDNLQGRKEHIAEHGAEYLDDLDVS